MHELRVDTYLTTRTANLLKYHGFDVSKANPLLQTLVDTKAWRDLEGFGAKSRDELDQALITVRKKTPDCIASAIKLLESHGYSVAPPLKRQV